MLQRLRDENGSAAVEFALVVPILVLLLVGIVEFGRAYNVQNTLTAASREAVRAVVLSSGSTTPLAVATTAATTNTTTVSGTVGVAVSFWNGSTQTTATTCATGLDAHVVLTVPFTLLSTYIPDRSGPNDGIVTLRAVGVMRCGG